MRSSPALVAIDAPIPIESSHAPIDEVVRALVELIDRVSAGSNLDSGSTEEVLLDTEVQGSRYLLVRMPKPSRSRVQLSPREQEIVRMVAKGHPNKVIADVLNISSWTVCTHLRRIFAKLGVGSRAAMVAQLLDLGVLSNEHRIPHGIR
ncbi:MAG TPA: LuxR C-terminal-related transcriptional regulator [Candidatus Sulfotelmatobacter sp.]|jgi:DNA-binding NarL/FixJ family response regulator|nr:LuxR C-terminal-related transcriptional regulator [Candidatus Sulfotelmatobacter sp.]